MTRAAVASRCVVFVALLVPIALTERTFKSVGKPTTIGCSGKPVAPSAFLIAGLVDPRTGISPVPVIALKCTEESLTPDGKYYLPKGLKFEPDRWCDSSTGSFTASNIEEYNQENSESAGLSASFGGFGLSASAGSKEVRQNLESQDVSVSKSSTVCMSHHISVVLDPNAGPELDPDFEQTVVSIPDVPTWKQYLRLNGLYVKTSCDIGASLYQYIYVENIYVRKYSLDQTSIMAGAKFGGVIGVGLEGGSSSMDESLKIYSEYSSGTAVHNDGGDPPIKNVADANASTTIYSAWAPSAVVPEKQAALSCREGMLLHEFLLRIGNNRTKVALPMIKQATEELLAAVGCTNLAAVNHDPEAYFDDGSCNVAPVHVGIKPAGQTRYKQMLVSDFGVDVNCSEPTAAQARAVYLYDGIDASTNQSATAVAVIDSSRGATTGGDGLKTATASGMLHGKAFVLQVYRSQLLVPFNGTSACANCTETVYATVSSSTEAMLGSCAIPAFTPQATSCSVTVPDVKPGIRVTVSLVIQPPPGVPITAQCGLSAVAMILQ